jgi:hypothetical protein
MCAGRWVYWVTLALSGVTLVLVAAYVILAQDNRAIQAEVNQRQQFINQSIQLGRVNEALIRALAAGAVNDKDDKLHELLAQNGIAINPTTGAPEPSRAPSETGAPSVSPAPAR